MLQSVRKQLGEETEKFGELLKARTDEMESSKGELEKTVSELKGQIEALEKELADEREGRRDEVEAITKKMREERTFNFKFKSQIWDHKTYSLPSNKNSDDKRANALTQ